MAKNLKKDSNNKLNKKTIEEIIKIATLSSEGLSDKSINIKEYYRDKVKPEIGTFKTMHKITPNLLFKSELDSIKEPNKFNHADIDSQGSPFFSARKLNAYVWATLYSKGYSATNSIQLFISATTDVINFGLCYGDGIKKNSKKESEFVTIIKENEEIYAEIFEKISNNQDINLYDHYSKIIEVNSGAELAKKWSSQSSVLGIFRTGNIPDDAGERIHKVLNDLASVFNDIIKKSNNSGMTRNEPNSKNDEHKKENDKTPKPPLNQILYGPPGTGKTYHTINKAIEIIEPNFNFNQDRKEIKKKFKDLVDANQIVFTTFHQSMSYEDFIEGIKPETVDRKVIYNVKNGIFKKLCNNALLKKTSNFEDAYNNFLKEINNGDSDYFTLETKTGKEFSVNINSNGNLKLFTTKDRNKQGVLTKEKLFDFFNNEPSFKGWEPYANGLINHLKKKYKLYQTENKENKNYVLIIDEINRGNISAIFGELITLIEEDKRLGKDEALEVKLPYSKKQFGVPPNLYIIGTMNTADRSVEALDSALRRRFSFFEMPPDYKVLENHLISKDVKTKIGIDLKKLLETINKRIEILLDKDHLIGHSYFWNVNNLDNLKEAFVQKIIPLLQEYFYGDYGKIFLVLGEGFRKGKKTEKPKEVFASVTSYETDDLEDKIIYEIKDEKKIDISEAIKILLRNSDKETTKSDT